jgi:hypothetical protein
VVACLPLDPRLAGYNSAEDDRLLKGDTIRSTPSLRGEVTSSVPCRKILWHVKDTYEYERDNS